MSKKITAPLQVNYATLPPRLRKMAKNKQDIALEYTSKTKLNAVLQWPILMKQVGMTGRDLAEKAGKKETRISEFLNIRKEPNDSDFLKIDGILHKAYQRMMDKNANTKA